MVQKTVYQELALRHGHYCPMSTLGVRLGEAALSLMGDGVESEWNFCYLAQTCAVDGLRLMLEGEVPEAALQVLNRGEHRLECRDSRGRQVLLELSGPAVALAAGYRHLSEGDQAQRLEWLRDAPREQLICQVDG